MSKPDTFTAIEKLAILEELSTGEGTRAEVARQHNISISTLVKWRKRYELYGMDGLEIRTRNRSYSSELRIQAVQDYLTGQYSQYELIVKYKIASRTQLKRWIDKYNGHSNLKTYNGAQGL